MEVNQADRESVLKTEQSGASETKARTTEEVILHPNPDDVLMGRGAPSTDFTGNLRFRELVKERRNDYVNAKRRKDKQGVAGEIIATVKNRGGRFLQRIETYRKTGPTGGTKKVTIWEPVEDRKTLLVKVKQLMRDVGPAAQEKRNLRREIRRQRELDAVAGDSGDEDKSESKTKTMAKGARPVTGSPASLPNFHTGMNKSPRGLPSLGQGQMLDYTSPMIQLMPPLHLQHAGAGDDASIQQRLQQEATARQVASLRQELQMRQEFQFRQELQQRQSALQREVLLREKEALSGSQRSDGGMGYANFSMPLSHVSSAAFTAQKEQFLLRKQLQDQQMRAVQECTPMRSQHPLAGFYLPQGGGHAGLGIALPQTGPSHFLNGMTGQQGSGPRPGSFLAAMLRQQQNGSTTNGAARFSPHQG
eukprot:scaffold37869_cov229-Amphora_coffeaeformis.AAC.3